MFLLRRLNIQLNKKAMTKVADSIFNSKIRYGLQLMGKVRIQDEDGEMQKDLKSIQLMQKNGQANKKCKNIRQTSNQ